MYDSQEISRVSQNLSLRLSPQRKYSPEITICHRCCCCPCRCCYACHCCPCTCFLHSPRSKFNNENNSLKKGSYLKGSNLMGSTNFDTKYKNSKKKYIEHEQKQFNDFLKKLMMIEGEIEKLKIDLCSNPDFNCEDAFRIFELEGRGYLDKDDLKYGLNLLDIYPTDLELRLLMKRFDLQKQGGISFADFFDIVVPFEKDYRSMVEDRLPRSCCPCRCLDVFSISTICTLKDLFKLLIATENEINDIRRSLAILRIKLKDVFELIDYLKIGYFNNKDLVDYFQKENIYYEPKDLDLLFIRLDKNRNGKIDYKEIEDELQTLY